MKRLAVLLLLLPFPAVLGQSPTAGTVLTFYITDENLVTDHRGVMTLSTAGLVDFTINGTPIAGPSEMVETGIDTGVFQLQVSLPPTVDGRALQNGDVVQMTYHQPADYSGHPQTVTQSVTLSSIPTAPVAPSASSINIGQYYTLQIYAPNYNLDSQVPDDIPLSAIEVHMGGVSTTLADSAFDIGNGVLRETGPNTDIFSATFKIPRTIGGFPVDIGTTLEFRVVDYSQPIPSESTIYLTVGRHYQPSATQAPSVPVTRDITALSQNASGMAVNFADSTALEGLTGPVCYPPSGSHFPVGKTAVTCSATNEEGTSVLRSFSVTVVYSKPVPHWVRNLASMWCSNNIGDSDFAGSVKFLSDSRIISLPQAGQDQAIDKQGICAWSEGRLGDYQALQMLAQLVR